MSQQNPLRRTEVHRNLDYRFTIFGVIEALDVFVVGTIAMLTAYASMFFDFALAWAIPVFIAGCLAMVVVRRGARPDDLMIKIKAAFKPRHLSILGRDVQTALFRVSGSKESKRHV